MQRTDVRLVVNSTSLLAMGVLLVASGLFNARPAVAQTIQAETCYRDNTGRIVRRRLPGFVEVPCPAPGTPTLGTPGGLQTARDDTIQAQPEVPMERGPRPAASPIPRPGLSDFVASVPVPDRWRIVDALGYKENLLDPYNRNRLKGDKPLHDDWFFSLSAVSDTVVELRNVASSVGSSSSASAGSNDVFGRDSQQVFAENLAVEMVLYQGDTVFKPPEYEFRFTPVFNFNRVSLSELQGVNVDPRRGKSRNDNHVGIQAAFVDKHLRNVSDNYDFDSLRIGIQPFSSDFRGFLFQDNQLGVRLFGNRSNNVYQYNLAWFRLLEKDTNSGLNDLGQRPRRNDVLVANLYRQDTPLPGFTSQATVLYNRNRENTQTHYDSNGVIQRPASLGREVPRKYDATYIGYNGDGHFGRTNVTASAYYVFGRESPGTFVATDVDIRAYFAAVEVSRDYDWIRGRFSLLYGSGDSDPYDRRATGFDAVMENPQFAGADTSYWIRQAVPLVGGGGVALSGRNGILNSLRPSKDEGQSNFTNPGVALIGIGADFDVLPTLRISGNANSLYFANTAVVEAARNQKLASRHIGEDLSVSATYRPLLSQNIVLRASYATLINSDGYNGLFPGKHPAYFLLNAVLAY